MKPGDQVREYILEQRIGAGGVGEVWRARHIRLNKPVAIKLILPHLCEDENIYSRFVQEAIATANLEHPHIISVHDFFSVGEDAFLVMSFIDGGSLQDRIRKRGALPVPETLHIAKGILDALDFAHQKGIVHRDVKPSNILLSQDLHGYLVDFGIALVLGKTRMTRFGANIGTPDYMSPEQIRGEAMDHRTDVYSFGCVLYEMVTGRSPFRRSDDDTEFTLMERHMNETPASVQSLRPGVSAALEAVILKSLAKDREQRFAGCADMAEALDAAVSEGAAAASGPEARRLKIAVGALALTTLIAAGGWMASYGQRNGSNAPDGQNGGDAAALRSLTSELRAAVDGRQKAENEARELRERLKSAPAPDEFARQLEQAKAAAQRAEQESNLLRKKLEAAGSSDQALARMRGDLDEARAAHANAARELRQAKQRIAQLESAGQAAKKASDTSSKAAETPSKAVQDRIARYMRLAEKYRTAGAYDDALVQLNAALALEPANRQLSAELERTRRACNAEKEKFGRTDLRC